jgi:hypothetical protein
MELEHPYLNGGALPNNEWPDHLLVEVELQVFLTEICLGASIDKDALRQTCEQVHKRMPSTRITMAHVTLGS